MMCYNQQPGWQRQMPNDWKQCGARRTNHNELYCMPLCTQELQHAPTDSPPEIIEFDCWVGSHVSQNVLRQKQQSSFTLLSFFTMALQSRFRQAAAGTGRRAEAVAAPRLLQAPRLFISPSTHVASPCSTSARDAVAARVRLAPCRAAVEARPAFKAPGQHLQQVSEQ